MNSESFLEKKLNKSEQKDEEKDLSRRDFFKFIGKIALGSVIASGTFKQLEKTASAFASFDDKYEKDEKSETNKNSEKYYRDWETLKTVLTEDVINNIAYVKEKFGATAAYAVLAVPLNSLYLVASMKKQEKEGADFKKTENGQLLLETASDMYNDFWNIDAIEDKRKKAEKENGLTAHISGFNDVIPGLSDEKFKTFLELHFDKKWLYGNVGSYVYMETPKSNSHHFNLAGEAHGRSINSIFGKNEKQAVILYRAAGQNPLQLLEVIAHEIAHHNDWECSNRLSATERLNLLREITDLFESDEHWTSNYIDALIPKKYESYGSKIIYYIQITEFWAELMATYLARPVELKSLSPRGYALAEKWYLRFTKA